MTYCNKRFKNLAPSAFGVNDEALGYQDLIDFSIGDPDLTTDKRILEASYQDGLKGMTHYTHPQGMEDLRQEIAKFYLEEHHVKVPLDQIMVTTSACHAMYLALQVVLDPGDEVLIPSPYFGVYKDQVDLAGGKCVFIETKKDQGFRLNPLDLEEAITHKTKALILNTPNNPTGAVLSKEDLKDIYRICRDHHILVLADDIYTLYAYIEDFSPMIKEDKDLAHTLTINSFSKDFVMTGFRIGSMIGPKDLIKAASQINEAMIYSAPSLSQRAALYALRYRDKVQPNLYKEFKARMDYAYQRIKDLDGFDVAKPQGTFYLFVNIEKTGLSSSEVCKKLLSESHILVLDGENFGPGGQGHIRLALTLGIDQMKEAFDRMKALNLCKA